MLKFTMLKFLSATDFHLWRIEASVCNKNLRPIKSFLLLFPFFSDLNRDSSEVTSQNGSCGCRHFFSISLICSEIRWKDTRCFILPSPFCKVFTLYNFCLRRLSPTPQIFILFSKDDGKNLKKKKKRLDFVRCFVPFGGFETSQTKTSI